MSDLRANLVALARSASTNEMLNTQNREQDSDPGKHARKEYFSSHKPHFQSGVLRTNCIDCLDRTNVAQYAYGLEALGRQLHAMQMSVKPKLDPDSSIATVLMEMYWNMGDVLAQQYGGSAAHNTVCVLCTLFSGLKVINIVPKQGRIASHCIASAAL